MYIFLLPPDEPLEGLLNAEPDSSDLNIRLPSASRPVAVKVAGDIVRLTYWLELASKLTLPLIESPCVMKSKSCSSNTLLWNVAAQLLLYPLK